MAEAITGAAVGAESRSRNRFGATIILGHALKHLYLSSLAAVLLPEIKIGLGLSGAQIGAMASAQQITGWFSTLSSGYIGDRFASRTGFMLGLSIGLTGVAYFFLGLAGNYTILLAAMLLVGLGPSMFHPPAIAALSRRFADRRAFAVSMHGTGGSLGEVLGPVTAAGLIAVLYWRDVLQLSVVPALIAAVLLWRLLRGQSGVDGGGAASFREYLGSFGRLLKQRAIILLCIVTSLRSVGQATTIIFLPVYLREDLDYSAGLVGAYISMAQVVGIGSQPLMGLLSDRYGHKVVLLPAMAGFAAVLLSLSLVEGQVQFALAILALGAFVFSMQAILISAAMEVAEPEMQATTVSLIFAASFLGSLSPTIAGVIADAYGVPAVFVFSSSLVALGTVVLALTRLPGRRRAAAGSG
jgi:FSR family fosmidomycin resistance protein-like MFS transporter